MHRSSLQRSFALACMRAGFIGTATFASSALAQQWLLARAPGLWQRPAVCAVGALAVAISGTALAVLQAHVLQQRFPRLRTREWVGVTLGVVVVSSLSGVPDLWFGRPKFQADQTRLLFELAELQVGALGALLGGAQWFLLRQHAAAAMGWIARNALAWPVAATLLLCWTLLTDSAAPAAQTVFIAAVGGGLTGLVAGGIAGSSLRGLRPWVDEDDWSMLGRICVVTGANRGIGLEVAKGLARLRACVVLLCRDASEAQRATREIAESVGTVDLHVVLADMASLESVHAAAQAIRQRFDRVDVLIHNAGAVFPTRQLSPDGLEATLAVDVFGPYLLTALLCDRLERSRARVISLAGIYQRKGQVDFADLHFARRPYHWLVANNQAQLARVMFTAELARRAPALTVVSVHPGAVLTRTPAFVPRFLRFAMHTFLRPGFVRAELGALPVLRLAAEPDPGPVSGRFYNRFESTDDAPDPAQCGQLWSVCEQAWPTFAGDEDQTDPSDTAALGGVRSVWTAPAR